jgi:signal peptidase I
MRAPCRRPIDDSGVMTPAVLVAVSVVLAALALTAARRLLLVVTVEGTSMQPTLQPGDRVLVRRRRGQPARGSVVVLPKPAGTEEHWVIKRVAALPGDPVPAPVRPAVGGAATVPPGRLVVLGDNRHSTDSRRWGFVPVDQVVGSVVRRVR